MSWQHTNKLLAHWQPKIKPEGTSLAWGSKERYKSLTPGAVAVAQAIASHLNKDLNYYGVSIKTLERELGFTKSTIGKALDELVLWGVFTRERTHFEKPFIYRLAIVCPSDCEKLEIHNTPSELATLPKKQATPKPKESATSSPIEQARGGLNSRQLIDTNKETNKEMNNRKTPCFNCSGEYETLANGNREIIHLSDCAQLIQQKRLQPWSITQNENSSNWDTLSNREQQIANYLSLAKGKERKAKLAEKELVSSQEQEAKFQKIVSRLLDENSLDSFLPNIKEWLRVVYLNGWLTDTHQNRAVEFTRLGVDLPNAGSWRRGEIITREHFLVSEVAND